MKRVPDPTQKAKIKDGHIDLTGASWIVNTFDEYAIEAALRLVENGADGTRQPGAEIVVVSLGPADAAKEIRTCLAMGADRAIHIEASDADLDSLIVVSALQAVIAAEKPDLVLMGKQAVDGDANQVAQMLAGKLGWAQATFAATIELADKTLLVGREVDGGVEYKRVPLPSIVSVDLRIVASHSHARHPRLSRRGRATAVAQGHHGGEEEAARRRQARRLRARCQADDQGAVRHAAASARRRPDRRRHPHPREEAR
ncbi:MAG: electron transfer flavoprotein subunit beta/FixA family protein [Proteobacteria bacterium]|nr:electron transfer flavoprotein subunit beta/FixA family protein [Pseudomonadota bacterium]